MENIARLIKEGDQDTLAAIASNMIGMRIDPSLFMEECKSARIHAIKYSGYELGCGWTGNPEGWNEDSWRTWLKTQYIKSHEIKVGRQSGRCMIVGSFHVGFLFLEETQEQIDRLQSNEPWKLPIPNFIRSRITRALIAIKPINVVASRVVKGF